MFSIQQKNLENMQRNNVWPMLRKKKKISIIFEWSQMLDMAHKNFKAASIDIAKKYREPCLKN